ncbi:hypothetical protein JMJ35_003220 [Cladonia borealis]|uniref:Coenzyme Q-binding protein COQ10 START domain-containing protein n=1 Tax=Cladonia borealis TaxID=184061 RepID=A0AA39V3G3_9LECA|nr:hypothetical protein JMJ35_003220 [Cladonia borealis]
MSPPAPLPNHPTVTSALLPPLPTPHWGAQSSPAFTVRATTTIAASPSLILYSLVDTSTWPQWNNFVPRVTVHNDNNNKNNNKLQPNILFTEHVSMRGRGRSSIVKMRLLMTTLEEISDDKDGRKGWRVGA